jgi:hypothetical protein
LAAWNDQAAGRNFQLSVEEQENGDFLLQALPFKTEEKKAPDGEVWMATVVIDYTDEELLTNEFMRDRYIRPVKRLEDVRETVVLLPYRNNSGTKFLLQACSNVPPNAKRATARTLAALRGFTAQLKAWFHIKAEGDESAAKLIQDAENCLVAAISSVA